MTTLTLPIVVGKKYVRRDGGIVTINELDRIGWADAEDGSCYDAKTGSFYRGELGTFKGDLVSDYIEPAKGLTIDHFGLIKEDSYGRLGFIGFVTSGDGGDNPVLPLVEACIERLQKAKQEELDRIANLPKPDPHAENAAEYAKDMALSDKAWEGWECRDAGTFDDWTELYSHPAWGHDTQYRRKEQA